jgi:acyl carrier protein
MELKEFAELMKEQYYDAAEITFDEDTDIRSIGSFDSLTGMSMMLAIKDNFDLDIDEKQWKSLSTPRQIFEFINSQK